MRVLVLAPHPYYVDRGTPIDLELVLRVLCAREGTSVDVVVYPDGEDRLHDGLTIHRVPATGWTTNTKPGFSLKKLVCDLWMFFKAWSLVRKHGYDVVHAGEEAVFMAMFFRRVHGIPYVYDLDSSIAQQMVEKLPFLGPVARIFDAFEAAAIRGAIATAPVCNALADLCRERGAAKIVTLHDISQLENPDSPRTGKLAKEAGTDRLILLYVGNLESYQGIDLLVEAFAVAAKRTDAVDLVIIGGDPDDIESYRQRADQLGIGDRTHFLGPRPLAELDGYLAEADILTAPRIRGINTPMKVFPYLHSGRAVLVTDLPTHSQILTPDVACLAPAEPEGFAEAIVELAGNDELRRSLGARGRAFVEAEHTFPSHRKRLNALYDWIAARLGSERG